MLPTPVNGLCRLALIAVALYLFFGVISPRIVALSPALTHYGEVQSLYGLHSASVYYTDQPTLASTLTQVRRAVTVSKQQPEQNAVN
ncbi:hypothetical protein [Desulfovibrio cuneatus]|uniref:hypothetical protein n=1 Tax=Desulfovibrio cuneatus TaxID=159728 RepID=UPI0004071626|nr:hypothetical protein [Desulfovibrio cuneatus]